MEEKWGRSHDGNWSLLCWNDLLQIAELIGTEIAVPLWREDGVKILIYIKIIYKYIYFLWLNVSIWIKYNFKKCYSLGNESSDFKVQTWLSALHSPSACEKRSAGAGLSRLQHLCSLGESVLLSAVGLNKQVKITTTFILSWKKIQSYSFESLNVFLFLFLFLQMWSVIENVAF